MNFNVYDHFTEQERKDYNSLQEIEAKRLYLQQFFKNNFLAFVYLLGYRDLGQFHLEQIRSLSTFRKLEGPVRRLWLWARGHFKTSLISEAHSLWLIVNNPNIRILIVSNTLEIAKKILGNIRSHLIQNEDFRYFFKEFCPIANKDGKVEFGTTEYFTIKNRNRSLKEPTCMCAGIGTNLTGLHFDAMKIDDLVTKDSVSNDTQVQSSKDYYASLRQLFDNPTIPREDVVGTPYHFNDLHADLRKHSDFRLSVVPAKDELDNIAFPERFSRDGLENIMNDPSVGPYQFSAQYLLNPINPKDVKFKEEWWNTYYLQPEGLAEYICVDPASTQKKKSDYTVIEHWGVDADGKHYLINGVRDKLTSFQRIDRLFEVVKKAKNLKWVNYEVLGGRHGDLEVIKERQQKEQVYFLVKETKGTTGSKRDRIEQRLVGVFNSGIIYFPQAIYFKSEYDNKAHDFVQDYKLEYLQFPFSEHDDILDCHSQMFQEKLMVGEKSAQPKKKSAMTYDDLDKIYEMIDNEQTNNPWLNKDQVMHRIKVKRFKRIVGA